MRSDTDTTYRVFDFDFEGEAEDQKKEKNRGWACEPINSPTPFADLLDR